MFGIPMWKVLVGAALQVIPIGGAFFTYENVKSRGWKRPAAAAGVFGALQLGISYLNLHLLTPSIPELTEDIQSWMEGWGGNSQTSGLGSLYMPRDGGLPRPLPMRRGIGLIDATYSMATRRAA